jgi:rare lipoprotein A
MKKILLALLATTMLANALEYGKASFYSVKSNRGTMTASGERLSDTKLTAAHRTFPFGSIVRITNLSNGKSILARVNDRGPFVSGRIIDVSVAAATILDFKQKGIIKVKVELIKVN